MKRTVLLFSFAVLALSCTQVQIENVGKKYDNGTQWLDSARVLKQVEVVDTYKAPEPPFEYDVTYEYLPGNFCNPERGAYSGNELHFRKDAPPSPRSVETLEKSRTWNCTLAYMGLYFMDYFYEDLPESVLDTIRQQFENVRKSGVKLVLRHAYSWNSNVGEQEPPVGYILRHIKQLKPLLQEYYDIIYVVQAGFIGTYGEWAFRTNTKGDTQDRMVVDALMDALPASRQVAIRTPEHSMKMYNLSYRDTITFENAFDGSIRSRLAGHNDCFLANETDAGTFQGTPGREFWLRDTRFISMGGEGCLPSEYCHCVNSYQQLKTYHWSYLSPGPLSNYWTEEGCKDDVIGRIGYRFVLNGAAFYGNFAAGKDFTLKLCLTNYGFASLINERPLEFIVMKDDDPSEKYVFTSKTDPRFWEGCMSYTHTETLPLPSTLQSGTKYTVYLNLPDESPNLHDDPRYSVRFANREVWSEKTGYNRIATFSAE